MSTEKRETTPFDIKGCIRHDGKVYVPLDGILAFCYRFGSLLAKDVAKVFESAKTKDDLPTL